MIESTNSVRLLRALEEFTSRAKDTASVRELLQFLKSQNNLEWSSDIDLAELEYHLGNWDAAQADYVRAAAVGVEDSFDDFGWCDEEEPTGDGAIDSVINLAAESKDNRLRLLALAERLANEKKGLLEARVFIGIGRVVTASGDTKRGNILFRRANQLATDAYSAETQQENKPSLMAVIAESSGEMGEGRRAKAELWQAIGMARSIDLRSYVGVSTSTKRRPTVLQCIEQSSVRLGYLKIARSAALSNPTDVDRASGLAFVLRRWSENKINRAKGVPGNLGQ